MRALVWQWGRRGAGPRYAAELAASFRQMGQTQAALCLSSTAELLRAADAPPCDLQVLTYAGLPGYAGRMLSLPVAVPPLARWLRRERIDVALCAMPAAMDLLMAAACRVARVPYAVVVHDADLHPGDRFPAQMRLQRWLVQGARGVFALSGHVAGRLQAQGLPPGCRLMRSALPPFRYGAAALPPPGQHGGALRLLSFGRLLPYKGLDLLADALALLPPDLPRTVRVVGSGPESPALDRLRALPGVAVENRWVGEDEVAALFGWADAVVLSHREASQSGVAAAAVAAGRLVVATAVGGLGEQLSAVGGARLCAPEARSLAAALHALLDGRHPPPDHRASAWPDTVRAMVDDLGRLAAG